MSNSLGFCRGTEARNIYLSRGQIRLRFLLWNLCRSQARVKEEGSAEGLQPSRVKQITATETTQITQDLEGGGMTWDDAMLAAEDRITWRGCVARCAASARKD